MSTAKKGEWVKIHSTILQTSERAPNIPEETKSVPLEMWCNGFLLDSEAKIGDQVTIQTLADRELQGTLTEIRPKYAVDYGEPQPELLTIGSELRSLLREVQKNA